MRGRAGARDTADRLDRRVALVDDRRLVGERRRRLLELGVGLGLELRLGGRGGLRLGIGAGSGSGARATGRCGGRGGGSTGGPPSSAGGKRSSASSASRISASPIERASSRSRRRSAQTSSVSLSIRFRPGLGLAADLLRLALGLFDAGGGAGARAPRDLVRGLMGALQDRGGLLADAVELATDRGLRGARGVQLGDVLLERGQVGVDDLAVVAAEDHGELGPYPRRRVDRAADQALGERVRVRGQPLGDRGVLHRLGGRRLLDGLLVDDRLLGRRRLELLVRLPLVGRLAHAPRRIERSAVGSDLLDDLVEVVGAGGDDVAAHALLPQALGVGVALAPGHELLLGGVEHAEGHDLVRILDAAGVDGADEARAGTRPLFGSQPARNPSHPPGLSLRVVRAMNISDLLVAVEATLSPPRHSAVSGP